MPHMRHPEAHRIDGGGAFRVFHAIGASVRKTGTTRASVTG
jgi:hypothetical protein